MDKKFLVLNIAQEYRADLENLPWDMPLIKWDDKQIKFLDIRKGISKHGQISQPSCPIDRSMTPTSEGMPLAEMKV